MRTQQARVICAIHNRLVAACHAETCTDLPRNILLEPGDYALEKRLVRCFSTSRIVYEFGDNSHQCTISLNDFEITGIICNRFCILYMLEQDYARRGMHACIFEAVEICNQLVQLGKKPLTESQFRVF